MDEETDHKFHGPSEWIKATDNVAREIDSPDPGAIDGLSVESNTQVLSAIKQLADSLHDVDRAALLAYLKEPEVTLESSISINSYDDPLFQKLTP